MTPEHLPSNDNPVQVIMECRGRYENYRFENRHAVAGAKSRKEQKGSQTAPPITHPTEALDKPVPDDLRSLLSPKKADPRTTIKNRTPYVPRKVKMILVTPDPNYSGSGARSGTGLMDVRERQKTGEARRKKKEADESPASEHGWLERCPVCQARIDQVDGVLITPFCQQCGEYLVVREFVTV